MDTLILESFGINGNIYVHQQRIYFFAGHLRLAMLKPKTLNPKNLKSKSLCIASVFIRPLVISISYCRDVLFECGQTRSLEGTCFHEFTMVLTTPNWFKHLNMFGFNIV